MASHDGEPQTDDPRTDAMLLAAAAGGDDAAFAVLVRRHVRAGTLLAAQYLGDRDEAEDVMQEAFILVHEKARDFDATRPFAPWLYGIVRRLAANRRIRAARRRRLLGVWRAAAGDAPAAPAPDHAVAAGMEVAALSVALRQLPPMQRACFELVALRELPIETVAAMHDISESTVRQHVFRARQALRGAVDDTRGSGRNR